MLSQIPKKRVFDLVVLMLPEPYLRLSGSFSMATKTATPMVACTVSSKDELLERRRELSSGKK